MTLCLSRFLKNLFYVASRSALQLFSSPLPENPSIWQYDNTRRPPLDGDSAADDIQDGHSVMYELLHSTASMHNITIYYIQLKLMYITNQYPTYITIISPLLVPKCDIINSVFLCVFIRHCLSTMFIIWHWMITILYAVCLSEGLYVHIWRWAGTGPSDGDCAVTTTSINLADRYAELAVKADRYDAAALVNKGNILMTRGDLEKARDCYREAIQSDASCVEAMYNLALVYKRLHRYQDALQYFSKLNVVLRNDAQVRYTHVRYIHCVYG